MNREEILETVADAIAEVKEIPQKYVTLDASFEELKIDSLDAIEIVFYLEDNLDVQIPDHAVRAMQNVLQVVDGLEILKRGEEIPKPAEDPTDAATSPQDNPLESGGMQAEASQN